MNDHITYPKCPYCHSVDKHESHFDYTLCQLASEGTYRESGIETKCPACGKKYLTTVHLTYYGKKLE